MLKEVMQLIFCLDAIDRLSLKMKPIPDSGN